MTPRLSTRRWLLPVAAFVVAVAPMTGCGTPGPSAATAVPAPAAGSPADRALQIVELTSKQATSIAVAPALPRRFQEHEEVVGRIAFETDVALLQAQANLIGAVSAADLSARALARVEGLAGDSGGLPRRELEQATSDARTAQANLVAARATLRAAGATDAEIKRLEADPRWTPGSWQGPWAIAQVPESAISRVRVGQPVDISVAAFPGQVFHGRVARLNGTVDEDTHRLAVRCRIDGAPGALRPGMLAELRIAVGPGIDAVAVPAEAVVRESDGSMLVWVTRDQRRFERRPVRTGASDGGYSQVLEGLRAGEQVVSRGGVFLSNLASAPAES